MDIVITIFVLRRIIITKYKLVSPIITLLSYDCDLYNVPL